MEAKIERAWLAVVPDTGPDPSYLEQDDFAERREQYERGDFDFVGVQACAELHFATEQGGWIIGPTIKSPGLWGIESDSGEDYLREVGEEETNQLVEMLEALGISTARARYAQGRALADGLRYGDTP